MKISEINPHIRYASDGALSPIDNYVYSYDSRLFYILDGACKIEIEDTAYEIKKDALLLWQAGTKYRFIAYDKIKMLVLNFDYTQSHSSITEPISPVVFKKFKEERIIERVLFEKCEGLNRPLILENMHSLKKRILRTVEKFNTVGIYSKELASAILKEALTECAAAASYSENKSLGNVDKALAYLKENFERRITNADLGAVIGYHPHHINRLVLANTGMTVRQHLISIRVDNAKELLTYTELTMLEVAERCGFENAAYFSNAFKSKVGVSPREYRKKHKNLV